MAGLCRVVWSSLHHVRGDWIVVSWPLCGQNKEVHRIHKNLHVFYISGLHRICSGENNQIIVVFRTWVSFCF